MIQLKGVWRYDAARRQLRVRVTQTQPGPVFRMPLEIGIAPGSGQLQLFRVTMSDREIHGGSSY